MKYLLRTSKGQYTPYITSAAKAVELNDIIGSGANALPRFTTTAVTTSTLTHVWRDLPWFLVNNNP
jgi:hypothetical protein